MQTHVVWLVLGIALVIVELGTGTLYLLFIGVAAIAAAAAAWLGFSYLPQVAVFGVIAASALIVVHQHRARRAVPMSVAIDLGQPVAFEQWIDAAERLARVRYRGTLWDARVTGECSGNPGEILYIRAVDGSLLTIARGA